MAGGRRGPMPKPTALRVLEGNNGRGLGRRPVNVGEPIPPEGMPAVPDWLPAEAKREWRKIAPLLYRARLLTPLDGTALAGYCLAIAQLRSAQAVLDAKGFTVTAPSDYVQQRPEVAIVRTSLMLIERYSTHFGLTPASRARITLPEEGEEDSAGILS
jgi:P27 family predicted phage terminase small subunit